MITQYFSFLQKLKIGPKKMRKNEIKINLRT